MILQQPVHPDLAATVVRRPRLEALVATARGGTVTVVRGPAGSGKTVLLRQAVRDRPAPRGSRCGAATVTAPDSGRRSRPRSGRRASRRWPGATGRPPRAAGGPRSHRRRPRVGDRTGHAGARRPRRRGVVVDRRRPGVPARAGPTGARARSSPAAASRPYRCRCSGCVTNSWRSTRRTSASTSRRRASSSGGGRTSSWPRSRWSGSSIARRGGPRASSWRRCTWPGAATRRRSSRTSPARPRSWPTTSVVRCWTACPGAVGTSSCDRACSTR